VSGPIVLPWPLQSGLEAATRVLFEPVDPPCSTVAELWHRLVLPRDQLTDRKLFVFWPRFAVHPQGCCRLLSHLKALRRSTLSLAQEGPLSCTC
jgi:hypothetical protein